jgi:hypothetical protein
LSFDAGLDTSWGDGRDYYWKTERIVDLAFFYDYEEEEGRTHNRIPWAGKRPSEKTRKILVCVGVWRWAVAGWVSSSSFVVLMLEVFVAGGSGVYFRFELVFVAYRAGNSNVWYWYLGEWMWVARRGKLGIQVTGRNSNTAS